MEKLKEYIVEQYKDTPSRVQDYKHLTIANYTSQDEEWETYLNNWEKNTTKMLVTELDRISGVCVCMCVNVYLCVCMCLCACICLCVYMCVFNRL